jgi:hypothetical protein
MPTIAPSHIYTFFALVTVAALLVATFNAFATSLKTIPESEQLQNLTNYVSAKGHELVTLATGTNSNIQAVLRLPPTIGNRQYWIRLRNESEGKWVEGGLGSGPESPTANRAYLPSVISVLGNYSSGYGPAVLECNMENRTVNLRLYTWRGKL